MIFAIKNKIIFFVLIYNPINFKAFFPRKSENCIQISQFILSCIVNEKWLWMFLWELWYFISHHITKMFHIILKQKPFKSKIIHFFQISIGAWYLLYIIIFYFFMALKHILLQIIFGTFIRHINIHTWVMNKINLIWYIHKIFLSIVIFNNYNTNFHNIIECHDFFIWIDQRDVDWLKL